MDPIALSGVSWDRFETFPEFMAMLKGNLGINFALLTSAIPTCGAG